MRLAFLGTPEVAAGTLRALVAAGHDVVAVVTRPDARRGRGPGLSSSPVKLAAAELGLPVGHRPSELVDCGAELGVVVAYGRIIKPDVLAVVPMVNVHFSLLPRWRGAAPVERAILAGDPETGVCLMALEEGLDTGPVYSRVVTPIGPEETAAELRQRLGRLGDELLLGVLATGLPEPQPQAGEPLYAAKLKPEELRLDFSRPAVELHRVVRVGRAWTTFRGRRLLVLAARLVAAPDVAVAAAVPPVAPGQVQGDLVATSQGWLRLLRVQPEGKAAMDGAAWARGARLGGPDRLGS